MSIDWETLSKSSRLLMEAGLYPAQGDRFYPTNFPDLNAATYELPDGTRMVLVESTQSMANRLEVVCWDDVREDLQQSLNGMPYLKVNLPEGKVAYSIKESHRLNSSYVITAKDADGKFFHDLVTTMADYRRGQEINTPRFARSVIFYDPNALLHGVFLSNVLDGRLRLPRLLSSFIEGKEVREANSGFAKVASFDPTGRMEEGWIDSLDNEDLSGIGYDNATQYKTRLKETVSNIIGHRREFVAKTITAYFSLDLAQLRAYGLGEAAERFLVTLALWKIRRFLETGLHLRSNCDFDVQGPLHAKKLPDFIIPETTALEADLPGLIQQCASQGLFVYD
jgi:CRISPR-associated protein Csb1